MRKINRTQLLDKLYSFATTGSGVVVGKPGIGKSYMLNELKIKLLENNILSIIIRIDNTEDSSDESISDELQLNRFDLPNRKWTDVLSEIKLESDQKAVLIFDSFDSARDEAKRTGFLRQIKNAKRTLQDKWNIIVSVRTYDAAKSEDLLEIFSPTDGDNSPANYRKIYIDQLEDAEIESAFNDDKDLIEFFNNSSLELREILRVPFFLNLLDIVLSGANKIEREEIGKFRSETQLLNSFWVKKIAATQNHILTESFLLKFTNLLLGVRTLSISKNALIQHASLTDAELYEYLRSEDILDETSTSNPRVSYSHNILFDYAVSRLCLDQDSRQFISFLSDDYSRAFFLRPSFVYFFTSLWHNEVDAFWHLYKGLRENQRKEIQLFLRLTINTTLASEYQKPSDLAEILLGDGREQATRNLLQSIRFVRNNTHPKDVELLHYISTNLEATFLYEFAFLLTRACEDGKYRSSPQCGQASRNLLSYVLQNRQENKGFYDRIGAFHGVPLVAKTFATDNKASDSILRLVFELIKEPDFEISYFTELAENLEFIFTEDPIIISDFYKIIFGHNETSEKTTSMGGSVIMNLVSNRRQDFDMVGYRLEKLFPKFLACNQELALTTGITIANEIILQEKGSKAEILTFEFKGHQCKFAADYSIIWAGNQYGNRREAIARDIIEFLEDLLSKGETDRVSLLINIFIRNAVAAYLWRLLLELLAKYPTELTEVSFSLVIIPVLLTSTDTSFSVRELIDKISGSLQNEQLETIENTIHTLYSEDRKYSIQAALSMLPQDRLQTEWAKNFIKENGTTTNEPPYRSETSVSTYTTEDWLTDNGVDLKSVPNSRILEKVKKLDAFIASNLNSTPEYSDFRAYLEIAKGLYQLFLEDKSLAKDLKFTIGNSVAKTLAICSRNLKGIIPEDFHFIKTEIQQLFDYISEYDKDQNSNSPDRGYSPTPRITASEALMAIYFFDKDPASLEIFQRATRDENSIVRFQAIKSLAILFNEDFDKYNEILEERLKNEEDAFVYSVLLSVLRFRKEKVVSESEKIIELVNAKTHLFQYRNKFIDQYAELLLWLLSNHYTPAAYETLVKAYAYPDFANAVIFILFRSTGTHFQREDFLNTLTALTHKIDVVNEYIDLAIQNLSCLADFEFDIEDSKTKVALQLFNEIITRIYFSLERRQRIQTNFELDADVNNRRDLYFLVKPCLHKIITCSGNITEHGLIIANTAHYLIQTLNSVLSFDPKDVLEMVTNVTKYSIQAGYTLDSFSIREIVKFTEQLLADHRDILLEDKYFQMLLSILEIHIESGWVDALQLLWKLDEIFK